MGYKNVHVYSEGLPEWVKRGYPAEINEVYPKPQIANVSGQELKEMIDKKEDIFILDIRDEDDRKAGWIKGSKHIDMEVLDENYSQVPKNKKVILVCLHGKQGYMAGRFLASKGYDPKNLIKLDGGMVGSWIKEGYPVEK